VSGTVAAMLPGVMTRHFGAQPAGLSVARLPNGRYRVRSQLMDWTVEELPGHAGRPFALLEVESDVTPTDHPDPLPVVAVLEDGRNFLLADDRELAAFLEAVAPHTAPTELAELITYFRGRGLERVLAETDLSAAGIAALGEAGAEAFAPTLDEQTGGGWELRYLTAAYVPHGGAGSLGVDLRAWSVRGTPGDGVEWQVRPLALQVQGALRTSTLPQSEDGDT
jgi:hypothetical protein